MNWNLSNGLVLEEGLNMFSWNISHKASIGEQKVSKENGCFAFLSILNREWNKSGMSKHKRTNLTPRHNGHGWLLFLCEKKNLVSRRQIHVMYWCFQTKYVWTVWASPDICFFIFQFFYQKAFMNFFLLLKMRNIVTESRAVSHLRKNIRSRGY